METKNLVNFKINLYIYFLHIIICNYYSDIGDIF